MPFLKGRILKENSSVFKLDIILSLFKGMKLPIYLKNNSNIED